MHDVTVRDFMNIGKVVSRGIVLGVGNNCVGVENVATGARGVWFRVGCEFGLDEQVSNNRIEK